jgi:hypothetical protein
MTSFNFLSLALDACRITLRAPDAPMRDPKSGKFRNMWMAK